MTDPKAIWLGFWRFFSAWNRYEVSGFDHLRLGRAALLVGYHGRPVAFDLCMLSVKMHDEMGYLPHGIVHGGFDKSARLKAFFDGLGFVTGDGEGIRDAVASGEHVITLPGGSREGMRSARHRYEVDWGRRRGYVRLAARYGLPIIPVASSGVDDAYLGLVDGYRAARALRLPFPLWLGVGPLGLWPLSPPFPVRMRQIIGEPLMETADGRLDPRDDAAVEAVHERVSGRVQALLDEARNVRRAA